MNVESKEFYKNQESEITKKAKEIASLFKRAKEATSEEQDKLFQEFAKKLIEVTTPAGRKPQMSEMLHWVKDIALGRSRDNTFYIGSGTSGQRIFFENYLLIDSKEIEKIERLGRGAKKVEGEDSVVLESVDKKPRWMRYPQPGGGRGKDWELGEKYWQRYIEVFGGEIVDLLEDNTDGSQH